MGRFSTRSKRPTVEVSTFGLAALPTDSAFARGADLVCLGDRATPGFPVAEDLLRVGDFSFEISKKNPHPLAVSSQRYS